MFVIADIASLALLVPPSVYLIHAAMNVCGSDSTAASGSCLLASVHTRTVIHLCLALVTVVATTMLTAPYGRHMSEKSAPTSARRTTLQSLWVRLQSVGTSSTAAWVIQELPILIAVGMVPVIFGTRNVRLLASSSLLLLHYVHRTLVFPFFIPSGRGYLFQNTRTSPTTPSRFKVQPLFVTVLATAYQIFNGSLQVLSAVRIDRATSGRQNQVDASMSQGFFIDRLLGNTLGFARVGHWPLFLVGVLIFFCGMFVNVTADYHVFALAKARIRRLRTIRFDPSKSREGSSLRGPSMNGSAILTEGIPARADPSASKETTLRQASDGYVIPYAYAFRWLAAPNYTGEILEWFGYSIAALGAAAPPRVAIVSILEAIHEQLYSMLSSIMMLGTVGSVGSDATSDVHVSVVCYFAALSFAIYTAANIGPRAFSNHRWYADTFGPSYTCLRRKALIPFLL